MKQFLLFAGNVYYPNGGWGDFVASFDSLQEAKDAAPRDTDWFQVVDTALSQVVAGSGIYN